MGRGLVLVPGGITILLGCHDVLLLLPQQDEDKHKAPAAAPHRPLSLREGRVRFVRLMQYDAIYRVPPTVVSRMACNTHAKSGECALPAVCLPLDAPPDPRGPGDGKALLTRFCQMG